MADFEPTGVRLIAEGAAEYLAALARARQTTVDFGQSGEIANTGMQTLSMGSMLVATTLGGVFSNAITSAIGQINQLANAGIAMTSQLQDTRLTMESLAASEIIASGAAENMTDALAQAAPVTDTLMEKLKEISLASPFEYRQILEVFQLNKAFGQTIDMSLELTQAITNLGAVNKGIPGILQRVSYNFSQMAMIGQITSRDVRDLAMAGVDLNRVLKDQLGKSIEQVNQDLKSGKITFEEVSKAFVGFVDKNFGDAAERASRTFSGLKSSFNDLAFFTSVDVFGGMLDKVTEKMSGFFTEAQEFVAGGGLKPVGAFLEVMTGQLMNLGETAMTAGANFYNKFGEQIIATATAAFDWGANVVVQLASGLIEGAAAALAAAMDYVSGLLSFWLAPGSPPKVAPDIDRWGTAAMGQFLSGFEDTDFSVLKSIGGPLNTVLSALVGAGKMENSDKMRIFQGLSGDMAQVIATGDGLQPVLDKIRNTMGEYGGEVAKLTEMQYNLGLATNKVREAEEALKKSREDEIKASEDLVRITDEYNALAKAGASPEVLAAKRAEFEAAKQRRVEAAKAAKQAEQDLKTSGEEASALKEKTDLQGQFLQQLVELTKEQQEAKKAGGGGAKPQAPGRPTPPKPDTSGITDAIAEKMEELKTKLNDKLIDLFKPISDSWEKARAIVEPAWTRFSTLISDMYEQYIKPTIDNLTGIIPPEFTKNLGWATGFILGFAVVLGIAGVAVGLFATALQSPLLPILLVIGALAALKTAWDADWMGMRTTLTDVWNNNILPAVTAIQNWLSVNIPLAIAAVVNWWNTAFLPTIQKVSDFITQGLIPVFQEVAGLLSDKFTKIVSGASSLWQDVLLPAITTVHDFIANYLMPLFMKVAELFLAGLKFSLEIIAGIFQNVVLPAISAVSTAVLNWLLPVFEALAEFVGDTLGKAFDGLAKVFNEVILPAITKVHEYIRDKMIKILEILVDLIKKELEKKLEDASGFFDKLSGAVDGVKNAVMGAIDWIDSMLEKLRKAKSALPDWMTPGSPTPWENGLRGVIDAMEKLNRVGLPQLQTELRTTDRAYNADAAAARMNLASAPVVNNSMERKYSLTLQTSMQPETVQQGFEYFRLLGV